MLKHEPKIIAIDGTAASGKGAMGKRLADYFGYVYLDTGKLYRAVGALVINSGRDISKAENVASMEANYAIEVAKNLKISDLDDMDLSSEGVGRAASIISVIPEVRAALLSFQRDIAASPQGAVLDGRDIGTIVCPNADYKFFISADIKVRAERRYKQLQNQDKAVIRNDVLRDLTKRDERDLRRKNSPMVAASDAISIDTTDISLDKVFEKLLSVILLSTSKGS